MSQPQTQTALLATAIGQPLTKATRSIPTPGAHQVQIKVTVAGLNPHDAKSRDYGLFIQDALPAVLAADVVGVVTQLGPEVTRFQPGDHVVGQAALILPHGHPSTLRLSETNNDTQGLQEYAVLDERYAAQVPSGFTDAQLATLPTNLVTAAVALFDASGLGIPSPWWGEDSAAAAWSFDYAGTSVLILGGGSNTGRFAIQLAALARIGRIVVVAGTKSAEEAKDLGATHVIDRTGKSGLEIAAEVRAIVGDELLYALDTINPPESQWIGVEALSNSQTGKLARLIPRGGVDESKLSAPKGAGFETVNVMGVSTARPATAGPLWNRVPGWVAQGKIKPTGFQVLRGLDVDAVNKVLDGYSSGAETGHWQVHL
ncbi:putative zinc-type alcohol dehydrogenase-like protein [Aspergillus japonicus CBS 114.51]|uniref:Putative zinc-type alcohol dehydrogenase-like protein n=1 Tax=Aspergillus japonicus CBS 114.51 TaxID=1448312 RepID=A0A8T8WN93_ASPJA|nr:putative zinc-type alcohol dehydrogenase-like protein [Aspergillus japonicus CBS 114.51]RAH77154.1 putative zinc-type alcohol dehydrogenase-like protein [Aspergillus japonicus CBS 114.51]